MILYKAWIKIGKNKLFRIKKAKETNKLKIISVAIKKRSKLPVSFKLVNKIGTCKKKNKMLPKKDELKIFFESSYNRFNIKPLERTSSLTPVINAVKIIPK